VTPAAITATEAVRLVLLTALGALPVGVVAWWWSRSRTRPRLRSQLVAVALAPMLATWAGAVIAARAMVISGEDLVSLGVIAATAALVGSYIAWRLSQRIDHDTAELVELSRKLGGGSRTGPPEDIRVQELRRLGYELTGMSERLGAAHERELALERSHRELVTWMSHDLRSPIAAIVAMSEAVRDGVVDQPADVARYVGSIGAEANRLARLVEDLFELSRLAAGGPGRRGRTAPLDEVVPTVVAAHRHVAAADQVRIVTVGAAPSLLTGHADEVARVLGNLLDNAVRHTPPGGQVHVEVSPEDSERAEVADRGARALHHHGEHLVAPRGGRAVGAPEHADERPWSIANR
jgi:signal transduction histidine kinase